MWQLLSGAFLGWSLGTNDAANVFGTAVASRMLRFGTAAVLASVFVILGALIGGQEGMDTYAKLSGLSSLNTAFIVSMAAALTVTLMSTWSLPVSTSQAVVGALVVIGLVQNNLDTSSLTKVVLCWIGTPIGAALITVVLYVIIGKLVNLLFPSLFMYDRSLRVALMIAGSYGAYALGANNVANVTGPFYASGLLGFAPGSSGAFYATALIGSVSIALGIITFSKKVMMTVGKNLVRLDAFTAFIAILSEAVTVHIYSIVGVPVSTSQAIVGAVLGVGLLKGVQTINKRVLWRILFGWMGTPTISGGVAFAMFMLFQALGLPL